jgi:hypothetical protein
MFLSVQKIQATFCGLQRMTMTKLKKEYKKCTHAKFGSKKKKKNLLVKTHFAMAFQTRQGGSANPHIPRNGPRASH